MATNNETRSRAPRGTKILMQAFFAALDDIPQPQQDAVAKAALAAVKEQLQLRRQKARAQTTRGRATAKPAGAKSDTARQDSAKPAEGRTRRAATKTAPRTAAARTAPARTGARSAADGGAGKRTARR